MKSSGGIGVQGQELCNSLVSEAVRLGADEAEVYYTRSRKLEVVFLMLSGYFFSVITLSPAFSEAVISSVKGVDILMMAITCSPPKSRSFSYHNKVMGPGMAIQIAGHG
jgi:hypothetical protein